MNYQKKYQQWRDRIGEEDPLFSQLVAMEHNETEKEESFYQDLAFGTAGLRGKVGAGSNRMNIYTVGRATQGIADYIVDCGQKAMDKGVVIAHDPRHMSKEFSELAADIFSANGIRVYTFPDLRPTPELAFMIRHLGAVSGINITASHNPKEYNGYKAYWEDGCQVSSQIADAMTEKIRAVDIWTGIRTLTATPDPEQKPGEILVLGEEYDRLYLDRIEELAGTGSGYSYCLYPTEWLRFSSFPQAADGSGVYQLGDCTGAGGPGSGFYYGGISKPGGSEGFCPE